MDFVKKHYDKIILGVVLLGVISFLAFLPFLIKADQDALAEIVRTRTNPKVTPLPPLDLTRQTAAIQSVQSPAQLDFSTTNRIFNPLEWKKGPDGAIFPIKNGNETGAGAAVVTKITPLYLNITFDSVETNGETPRYVIGVEHQAAASPAARRKQQRYVSAGEKKDFFTLLSVQGDAANPSALILKFNDGGDTVAISQDKPYQRVDAYVADLKYELDKPVKVFSGRRVGSVLSFGGEEYIVVAVSADEVILSAQSNQKKTTLRYVP
jgi:hypothetical protein